jgi:hypothetical protein
MADVTSLHEAVKRGDLERLEALLAANRALANSVSETDARGAYPLRRRRVRSGRRRPGAPALR